MKTLRVVDLEKWMYKLLGRVALSVKNGNGCTLSYAEYQRPELVCAVLYVLVASSPLQLSLTGAVLYTLTTLLSVPHSTYDESIIQHDLCS